MSNESITWLGLLAVLVAAGAILAITFVAAREVRRAARDQARRTLADARQEAERKANEAVVSAQERAVALREDLDRRETELEARENALDARARKIDGDMAELDLERRDVDRRREASRRLEESAARSEEAARETLVDARRALERAAGMSADEAREQLLAGIEDDAKREAARVARRIEEDARDRAERDALQLVVQATERLPIRAAVETTVAYVQLPSDEMKGRIIGREGRNIRALEMATGIDVIVDDTPSAILISSFDPLRREIARVAIARLIEDGRIHPGRIEEVVSRVRTEIDAIVDESGVQAAFALGISDLHPRLARLVGRMKFRSHHGQNLLQHCNEVALIAGHMAGEVGARPDCARRAGLLHEIGRVDDASVGHTLLASAELAGKYGEAKDVVHAIQSLHPDTAPASVEALLLGTANRVADNRPGARKDNLEVFVERLRRLESIASAFPGVSGSFAVKAGKEIRVLIDSEGTDDDRAYALSKEIARAIEQDLDYAGQIRVSVVREFRSVQFAV